MMPPSTTVVESFRDAVTYDGEQILLYARATVGQLLKERATFAEMIEVSDAVERECGELFQRLADAKRATLTYETLAAFQYTAAVAFMQACARLGMIDV